MAIVTRRALLAVPLVAAVADTTSQPRLPIRKAVEFSMLPGNFSVLERFQLAHDCGFEQIECGTTDEPSAAQEILEASKKTNVLVHSVMNRDHWNYPLSSPDPAVVDKSMKGLETSLHNAKLWGCDTVLLVPAVVTPEVSYKQAWERSQVQVRKILPLAQELQIIIGIEEVWNKFLLSPLEFAQYVDEFQSPWIRAYFDVGNVVISGYPQDWIRTLGKRIVKLHLKDFTFKNRVANFVNLRDGEIDWKAVYRALAEIGYRGTATVELDGGGEAYLRDVSHRVDLILSGQ